MTTPKPKILIVEDEPGLVQSLAWYFNREEYETLVAKDGETGLRIAQTHTPNLILLDVMLPGKNGMEVCRELRASEKTAKIPVIMLTARAEENDQVMGFSVGADDYVTKPFNNKILLQRVKALLRRVETNMPEENAVISHLGVSIDLVRHRVTVNETVVELTPTEFKLLECMLRSPGRPFSRSKLMDSAIGEGHIVLERTIDVHVKTLRRKLNPGGEPDEFIETVRGVGYRFREHPYEGPSDEDDDGLDESV